MYIPKHFEITDSAEIDRFIEANSFGQLISLHDGAITSTHLPFLHDLKAEKLICHLARANPQWQQISGQAVLITLPGNHAYVSPSWYKVTGVPTWNYQAVHVQGVAAVFNDPDRLKHVVDTLTAQNESGFDNPWTPDYAAKMLSGIVGVEIAISSLQCKFKLSQNRSAADQSNVRQQLDRAGYKSLAGAMAKELE
ncbi:MAG: FMN-binding negative transcriptional regulator [Pseudohongiellaceae bacterium]